MQSNQANLASKSNDQFSGLSNSAAAQIDSTQKQPSSTKKALSILSRSLTSPLSFCSHHYPTLPTRCMHTQYPFCFPTQPIIISHHLIIQRKIDASNLLLLSSHIKRHYAYYMHHPSIQPEGNHQSSPNQPTLLSIHSIHPTKPNADFNQSRKQDAWYMQMTITERTSALNKT